MRFAAHRRRQYRARAVVRLAGLIDLVSLLLTFFLATTALLDPEFRVGTMLQGRGSSQNAVHVPPVVVHVHAEGWSVGPRACSTVSQLRHVLEGLPSEPGVDIAVSADAPAGHVVVAVREARQAGMQALRLQTP